MEIIDFVYIPLVLLLYLRTWKYNILIDDPVPRDGYMYIIQTEKQPKELYEKRKSLLATFTNIGVFLAVCGYIDYMYGWQVALLYAVFPLNVSGVAWNTGNYYMSTVLLVLATHLFISVSDYISIKNGILLIFAVCFYIAALNSTLSSIPLFFYEIIRSHRGWVLLIPLLTFLFGKRMKTGLKKRADKHEKIGVKAGEFKWWNILIMFKVTAYYIALSFWPSRLGFFHEYGKDKEFYTIKRFIICLSLIIIFFIWGFRLDKSAIIWWFLSIGIFSQFVTFGQFVTERYTYIANIAFCILIAKFLHPYPYAYIILVTLWFYRSHLYIPAWKNNERLFNYSMISFPKAPENYNNLSSYYLDYKRYTDALRPLLMALRLADGKKANILVNLANCYASCGVYDKALDYTTQALAQPDCNKDTKTALLEQSQRLRMRINNINVNRKKLRQMEIID